LQGIISAQWIDLGLSKKLANIDIVIGPITNIFINVTSSACTTIRRLTPLDSRKNQFFSTQQQL